MISSVCVRSIGILFSCVFISLLAAPAPATTDDGQGCYLKDVLKLHRAGAIDDGSVKYDEKRAGKSYAGHVREKARLVREALRARLLLDTMHIAEKSKTMQQALTTAPSTVCGGTQLLQDLEVLAGKPGSDEMHLVSKLALAQTSFGLVQNALMLSTPLDDMDALLQRQLAIYSLQERPELMVELQGYYGELAQKERYMIPLLADDRSLKNPEHNIGFLLLEIPGISALKKHPWVATAQETFRTTLTQLAWLTTAVLSTVGFTTQAYTDIRKKAFPQTEIGAHLQREMNVSTFLARDLKWTMNRFTEPSYTRAFLSLAAAGVSVWWLSRIIGWIHGDMLSKKIRWQVLTKVARCITLMRFIYEGVKEVPAVRALPDCGGLYDFFEKHLKTDKKLAKLYHLLDSVPLDAAHGSPFFLGHVECAYDLLKEKGSMLADLALAAGRVEVYLGCAQKIAETVDESVAYHFADYVAPEQPVTFDVHGLWNPFLDRKKAVTNDVLLGGINPTRLYLVTGLNAGGKSTVLKAVALAALMAQTLTIVPARSARMSVFSVIETYLNITDDLAQGNSLFKREVMRAAELLHRIEESGNKPALLIFDEMFNGTTPYQGVSCAYAVAERLAKTHNVVGCIATHFEYLTRLASQYDSMTNVCVRLDRRDDGTYARTYKLNPGVTTQHAAFDMLADEGVDREVVMQAREVLKDIEANGL